MTAPIFNPAIPSVHQIPNGMYPGRMIRVQGSTPPGADRFEINLQCGPSTGHRDDIALHLNPRFHQRRVVRNHLTCRSWGNEEIFGGMPLVAGKPFEALILCEKKQLKVMLNGIQFCEFSHRLPYQCVSHLSVDGDVTIQFIGFEGTQAIPSVHQIPHGMYPGRMIRVQGSIPPGADRFEINLQCGPSTDHREDIALHFNPRFVQSSIVRNHLTCRKWGNEETSGGMPLAAGKPFEALILCEQNWLKIALNGMHFCEFSHRVPYQRISHLTVEGEVMIQFIGFEGAQAPAPQSQLYNMQQPAYGTYVAPLPAYVAPGHGAAPQGFY